MITVNDLMITPIKSTSLIHLTAAYVAPDGILEDRRFYLVNSEGELVTQREVGALALVRAEYKVDRETLSVYCPDGVEAEAELKFGESIQTTMFHKAPRGQVSNGRIVEGPWSKLISDFCGQWLRLVQSDEPGYGVDVHPITVLSQASVEELNRKAATYGTFDAKRFRANVIVDGCSPQQEDEWVGKCLRVGKSLTIRIVKRDPRCVVTTVNPATGICDVDTLRAIASYRSERGVYFGVYATVESPGLIHVGDTVELLR